MRLCLVAVVLGAALTASPTMVVTPLGAAVDLAAGAPVVDEGGERWAVRGIVTALSDGAFTITSSNRRAKRLTFLLDSATVTSGTLAVGERVSVRYRMDGDRRIATAVTVRAADAVR